jgi:nicotinamide mononucleotide transporter
LRGFSALPMLLFVFSDLPAAIVAALRATSGLEWVAVLTGFACVWLAARESLLNFPVAIVSCLLYVLIYYRQGLYSDSRAFSLR